MINRPSNSPLVDYRKISPNSNIPRNRKIDTITIHCIVGQIGVESLGNIFASKSRQASSNYGIGSDGRVGQYIDETNRSWCSSNYANDNRAVTIEVASDMKHPYGVKQVVYDKLVLLCADIVKRNGMVNLKWQGDKRLIGDIKKQNMTVHRWFSNTACPGDYLYYKMGQIAKDVNKVLGQKNTSIAPKPIPSKPSTDDVHDDSKVAKEVIAGKWGTGNNRRIALTKAGYNAIAVQKLVNEMLSGKVQTVSPKRKANDVVAKEVLAGKWGNGADRVKRLTNAGYNARAIQNIVNKGNNKPSGSSRKSVKQIAKEVIDGKWGNGNDRRNRLTKAGYNYAAIQAEVNRQLRR